MLHNIIYCNANIYNKSNNIFFIISVAIIYTIISIKLYLLQQKQISELETELDALQNELNMFGVCRFFISVTFM